MFIPSPLVETDINRTYFHVHSISHLQAASAAMCYIIIVMEAFQYACLCDAEYVKCIIDPL
jgi:hypothetical protein